MISHAERSAHYYRKHNERARAKSRRISKRTREERPSVGPIDGAKQRAKKLMLEYSIDRGWGKSVWTGRCSITGIPFRTERKEGRRGGGQPLSPSIDRIDQLRGYVPDNCRFILFSLNSFRGQMSDAEMLLIAKALVANENNLITSRTYAERSAIENLRLKTLPMEGLPLWPAH